MLPTYSLALHLPPPPPKPTLTVSATGHVCLTKALTLRLGLRPGQPIDLLPPGPNGPAWQLDLRPTAGRRLYWYADTRPRLKGVRLPPGLLTDGGRLVLALNSPAAHSPGLYSLTPAPPATQ